MAKANDMDQSSNDDLANLGHDIIKLLRFLIAIVFISLAIISATTVMGRRSSETNTKILNLVQDCVVEGHCGPATDQPDPQTVKIVNYIVDSVNCVLLTPPENRTEQTIENCKQNAVKKIAGG